MNNPHRKLNEPQKVRVVQLLACYWTPSEVVAYVREEWYIEIRRQSVQHYDPTKVNGQDLAKKWHDIFHTMRHAFLKDKATHAVANLPYRLGILQKTVDEGLKRGNYDLVLRALEQAAKDEGGSFTNRQRVDIDQRVRTGVMMVPISSSKEDTLKLIEKQQAHVAGAGSPDPDSN